MTNTFKELTDHPKIKEAKKLIQEAVVEKQAQINGPKPASSEKENLYLEKIDKISQQRGGQLFYNYLGTGMGKGALVELADGSVKYDFITGIGVHYLGHQHLGLMNALIDGAISNTVMQGHLQQNTDSAKLIHTILTLANQQGAQLDHCFLTSSGVMANENALKIAFQKRSPANRVLAFKKCFHGRTLAVSQITDKEAYRLGLPKNLAVDHIPFYDHQNPELSTQESLNALQKLLDQHPGEYAAMLMEVIQGEAGSYPGTKEYFHQLCSLLKKNNISIIVDEVQSFGRTEKIFAFQLFELDQYVDIVTIGKMSLTCATLFRNDHKPKPGLISQTFTSSSTAIKASQYVLDHLVDNHYFGSDGKIAKLSSYFREQLIALNKKYPQHIKGPYGIGAMVAMTIADGDPDKSKAFIKKLFDNGVMSFTAGGGPTRIRFLMPVGAVEESDIKNACEIIEKTLVELLG